MIDIGLTKIAMIGVVALVVIGPEKLPRVARMAGSLFGRAQRYINDVKSEVSREIELEELRKMQKDIHHSDCADNASVALTNANCDSPRKRSNKRKHERPRDDQPTDMRRRKPQTNF